MNKIEFPRILIISDAAWDNNNNLGNTLTNIFDFWPKDKIAMIYTKDASPNNDICSLYFQISEVEMIKKIFSKNSTCGQIISDINYNSEAFARNNSKGKKIYGWFKKLRLPIFLLLREVLWEIKFKMRKELINFINEYKPGIIFYTAHSSIYMNKLVKFVKINSSAQLVMYFMDDVLYKNKSKLDILARIYQDKINSSILNNVSMCSKIFTIIDKQREQYKNVWAIDSEILNKWTKVKEYSNSNFGDCIRMVYTGNLYIGRSRTIIDIAGAIAEINKDNLKIIFDIYSREKFGVKELKKISTFKGVYFHGSISHESVKNVQKSADVLLHVESFTKKFSKVSELSFSTKIVDYLSLNKVVIAAGNPSSASISYLSKNKSAIIIEEKQKICYVLNNHLSNKEYVNEIRHNANKLLLEKHDDKYSRKKFYDSINALYGGIYEI